MGERTIGTLRTIWDGFDFTYLVSILLGVIPSLLCITLHELSHGYVAYLLGDDTAKRAGRLTLNPLKHLDPIGLLMMLVFRFGWAKPVPVNMMRFKHPKRGMAVTVPCQWTVSETILDHQMPAVFACIARNARHSRGAERGYHYEHLFVHGVSIS